MPKTPLKYLRGAEAPGPQNFYLKFTLDGPDESFVYQVTEETAERVSKCFGTNHTTKTSGFVEFEDISGTAVNVNPKYVVVCHALWDAGVVPAKEPRGIDLTLFIHGIKEPQKYDDLDLEELYAVADALQGGDFEHTPFVTFLDEDGERVFVRSEKIMLMESVDYTPEVDE